MWFVMRGPGQSSDLRQSQKARNLSRDARLSALVEAGELRHSGGRAHQDGKR
jgi:hypothetical protein